MHIVDPAAGPLSSQCGKRLIGVADHSESCGGQDDLLVGCRSHRKGLPTSHGTDTPMALAQVTTHR